MNNYTIEKWTWSHEDFEQMGWHDATIHAMAFLPETFEFALDLDYIFDWIEPSANQTYYNFLVSPVTLVFENVNDLDIDLSPNSLLQLQNIERLDSRKPRNADHVKQQTEWQWKLDSDSGVISFWSIGFKQFIRQAPLLVQGQALSLDNRGGFSFCRGQEKGGNPKCR